MSITELTIEDIETGSGKETQKGALLVVEYIGKLTDGTVFDTSKNKGRPFEFVFGTGRVIKGWDQGLVGMRAGGKRKLQVPAALGYGERQIGSIIPPNSDLFFEIELLEVRTRD